MTTVFNANNVRLPSAPDTYFEPNTNGAVVPAGFAYYRLSVNQANVPATSTYSMGVEFQRANAWTDKAGIIHPAGEWLPDAGGDFDGGTITHRDGSTTTVNTLTSSIGARDSQGNMVEPYPNRARLRVDSWDGSWLIPNIKLDLSATPF